jgi:tripartite-type tricarboxylate transporter receptor subunit TctC
MIMKSAVRIALANTVIALLLGSTAHAAYPDRPINLIVGFVPGGGTDIVARALVPYLEKYLGGDAKVLVSNRGGAGGEIGFTAIANAPPDGYTIGFINSPSIIGIAIERTAQYGTWEKFELLGNVVDDPASFAVLTDSPIKDLVELAAFVRANPGKLTFGTPGIGAPGHIAGTLFGKLAGGKMNHVPYKGAGDVHGAIAGRHVMVAAISVGEAYQGIKGGRPLRVLGQLSPGRTTIAPDLKTAKEQGFDLEMSSLRGIAGPKGLPADIRDRLVKAIAQAVADAEFQTKSIQYHAPLRYLNPAQYEASLRAEDVKFRQLWKEAPWSDK